MLGHFGAYGSEVLSQALTRVYEGVRWPTLPDKVTLWNSVSILIPDGADQSTTENQCSETVGVNMTIFHFYLKL